MTENRDLFQGLDCLPVEYTYIEKKALALVSDCKKFYQYIYGRRITIESNPLQNTKPQNIMMTLQRYDFEVEYVPENTWIKRSMIW